VRQLNYYLALEVLSFVIICCRLQVRLWSIGSTVESHYTQDSESLHVLQPLYVVFSVKILLQEIDVSGS